MKNKFRKTKIIYLLLALLFAASASAARADSETEVLQAYLSEQTMTIFTDSELRSDSLACSVSNQSAGVIATGKLSDEAALTKTTLLVDISTSIPEPMRDRVIAALRKLIETKPANEEFEIIAFGENRSTLQAFSSDRYDLAGALDKIKFDGNRSEIYDALYNTIPRIAPTGGRTTFYRTVVITDGVDDTQSGITKEELFIKLQSERYPIDVVAVSGENAAEDKELSAVVRMSSGRYHSLDPGADIAELARTLGVGEYFFFKAKVPAGLLDGSTRQVDIDDGSRSVSFDVKFPVFDAPPGSAPNPAEDASAAPAPVHEENTFSDRIKAYMGFIIAAAVVLLLSGGLAVFLTVRKRKTANPASGRPADDDYGEKTTFVGAPDSGAQFTIKLSSPHDPSKTWTLPVIGELLIGRAEYCAVRLDDKTVSREQCKIIVQGEGLAVVHMSSTNKTVLNSSNITGTFPLQHKDTLKFGHEALHIDYIQKLGDEVQNNALPEVSRDSMTESVFLD
jgi:hypothetical protein